MSFFEDLVLGCTVVVSQILVLSSRLREELDELVLLTSVSQMNKFLNRMVNEVKKNNLAVLGRLSGFLSSPKVGLKEKRRSCQGHTKNWFCITCLKRQTEFSNYDFVV